MGRPQPRTPSQNRALWGAVQQLAQATSGSRSEAEVALRAICQEVAGHEHTSRLTVSQADVVLERLRGRVREAQGPRPPAPTRCRTGGRDQRPITRRQQEVLAALFDQIGWPERHKQMAFCRRQFGMPWPQTQAHADKLFEPLKAIALRHIDPEDAWRRAEALRGHPGLDAWQRSFVPDLCRQFEAAQDLGSVLSPHKVLKLIEAEVAAGVRG